VLSVNSGKHT